MSTYKIYRKFFTPSKELLEEANKIQYRPCPKWLGNFNFKIFGKAYGREYGKLPSELHKLAHKLKALVTKATSLEWEQESSK